MTLDYVSAAVGLEPDAAVPGDPYSPSCLADGQGDGSVVIIEIHVPGPRR